MHARGPHRPTLGGSLSRRTAGRHMVAASVNAGRGPRRRSMPAKVAHSTARHWNMVSCMHQDHKHRHRLHRHTACILCMHTHPPLHVPMGTRGLHNRVLASGGYGCPTRHAMNGALWRTSTCRALPHHMYPQTAALQHCLHAAGPAKARCVCGEAGCTSAGEPRSDPARRVLGCRPPAPFPGGGGRCSPITAKTWSLSSGRTAAKGANQ